MGWNQSIDLKGFDVLMKQFTEIADAPNSKEMEEELLKIAKELKQKIQIKISSVAYDTGRLYNSIRAKKFKTKIKNAPAVYVAVDRSPKTGAPHYHLVEFGSHGIRVAQTGKYKGRSFGIMPSKPFFRPTVDTERSNMENKIKSATESIIKKAAG